MADPILKLIEGGQVYTPQPIGRASVLVDGEKLLKVGEVDRGALDALKVDYEVIDATNRLLVPGLIDPHEHLLGASGDGGFANNAPPILLTEIVSAGITTVVGTLGTDSTTTNMAGLVARAKGLKQSGVSAYCYTGGYNVPPSTLTGTVKNDLLLIEEIVACGEVAISDARSTDPTPHELARIINDAYVGGLLTGKAGVTHFHVGGSEKRLSPLRQAMNDYEVKPESLYPTHVERSEKLMREALELVRSGATVDIDVVEKDLPQWVSYYFDRDGNPDRITVSSDSFLTGPHNLFEQLRLCIRDHGWQLERLLPLVTSNTARVLKLPSKGRLEQGLDADLVILDRHSLDIVHVMARGQVFVRDGQVIKADGFLKQSDRRINIQGDKADS